MKRYDLHTHTTCSDGELSTQELLQKAKEVGLEGISITDHDTIDAYLDALKIASKLDLEIVTGVEISTLHQGKSVHVLGYSFATHHKKFNEFLTHCQQMRFDRNIAMIKLFNRFEIDITQEELEKTFQKKLYHIGRPHFAKLLISKGYVKSLQEAFNLYLADDKRCYVVGQRPSVEEAINSIHKANGFAIIAHPHLIQDPTLARILLKMKFDGLEGYYAKLMPEQEEKWIVTGKNKRWLITGGSDFHGPCKPLNALGSSWVSSEVFDVLKTRFLENEGLSCH